MSQSPDGDFFDPAAEQEARRVIERNESQSPDGDFFDPAWYMPASMQLRYSSHSPLTGIFLIRRRSLRF